MIRTTHLAGLLTLAALATASLPAAASGCAATVESTDAMQFTTKSLTVPSSCKQFTVTLKHTGKLPVNVMGHNFVVTRAADVAGVAADGMKAGIGANYVKPGDARVIAASKVIGGGGSTTVTIPVARLKAGETYAYICSFPGHSAIMRGTLAVK